MEHGARQKTPEFDQVNLDLEVDEKQDVIPPYQDAFGNEEFAEVKYKVLKWWQCGLLMVAETVSLGVLSLPAAIAAMGFVPSIIVLIGLGVITSYTGFIMGQMKLRYPQITTMADAGEVIAGKFGREFVGAGWSIFFIFIMASHLLTFTVAMNTITDHGTCTIVFGIVGMVLSFICTLPRTLEKMSWLSIVSFVSILSAVLITMIALGIEKPGSGLVAVANTNLYHGFTAVTNIVFAFCSHGAFFGLMAELRNPRDFTKSLCLLQGIDISLYLIAAVVIYRYAGDGVTSPALGSASPIVSKIAYGIALPTVCFSFIRTHILKCQYLTIPRL